MNAHLATLGQIKVDNNSNRDNHSASSFWQVADFWVCFGCFWSPLMQSSGGTVVQLLPQAQVRLQDMHTFHVNFSQPSTTGTKVTLRNDSTTFKL